MPTADRTYSLRHPDGFDAARLEQVKASAQVWLAWLNALAERAPVLFPELTLPPEVAPHQLLSVERTDQDQQVHLGLTGGPGTHGWLKLFEDTFPEQLYTWLPLWFQLRLDVGRRDTRGFFDDTQWHPLYPEAQRQALAVHPAFRRPDP